MTRTRALLPVVVFAAVAGLLVAGCGSSEYEYVKNADAGLYFKLPSDWAQFDEFEIVTQPALGLQPLQQRRLLQRTWIRGFDASERPMPIHALDLNGPSPRGMAEVRLLTEDERSQINLGGLRSLITTEDPIEIMKAEPDGPVEVLSLEDVTFDEGHHGVRMLMMFDANASQVVVVDFTAVVDAKTERLFTFVIGCEESCFVDNQSKIQDVADSWTIKEP